MAYHTLIGITILATLAICPFVVVMVSAMRPTPEVDATSGDVPALSAIARRQPAGDTHRRAEPAGPHGAGAGRQAHTAAPRTWRRRRSTYIAVGVVVGLAAAWIILS